MLPQDDFQKEEFLSQRDGIFSGIVEHIVRLPSRKTVPFTLTPVPGWRGRHCNKEEQISFVFANLRDRNDISFLFGV